jgi:hypothetical protein
MTTASTASRVVMLAAALAVAALLAAQLMTVLLAVIVALIVSLPLSAAANLARRHGLPRGRGSRRAGGCRRREHGDRPAC